MTAGTLCITAQQVFSSATPALRGNEVNMDTIELGNNESLVWRRLPQSGRHVYRDDVYQK
ncbi:putative prophage protein [Escherichia coli]|nr:putative prophage protein [Escherichia coli]